MKKLTFSELNARLQGIFETEDKFEGFKNLSFDLAHGHEIFDDEGNINAEYENIINALDSELEAAVKLGNE